jgi:hypothetical protein
MAKFCSECGTNLMGTPSLLQSNKPGVKLSPTKRKLSSWNKFVKANSKKKIYQYANGKLKLKKMGIAFRKTKR